MRIAYDAEFIEDGRTINLISIGLVAAREVMFRLRWLAERAG